MGFAPPNLPPESSLFEADRTIVLTRKNALLLALLCEIEADLPADVVNDALTLFLDDWATRRNAERRK